MEGQQRKLIRCTKVNGWCDDIVDRQKKKKERRRRRRKKKKRSNRVGGEPTGIVIRKRGVDKGVR